MSTATEILLTMCEVEAALEPFRAKLEEIFLTPLIIYCWWRLRLLQPGPLLLTYDPKP